MNYYPLLKPLLFCLEPEKAHNLSIIALKNGLVPKPKIYNYPSLRNKVFDFDFLNPVGLAAGYDKNAETFNKLDNFGFGFVECGTVTPKAQSGNPKPRLFRLKEDHAVINRLGFNNCGSDFFLKNVQNKRSSKQILGINIGKNKDTIDEVSDYLIGLEKFYQFASYITINISSPNTANLRNIQKADILSSFLKNIGQKKEELNRKYQKNVPILLKIAPDLSQDEIIEIADIILKQKISGVIISNTTINFKDLLSSPFKNEIGGLSGKPLFKPSNEVLKIFYRETKGQIPIIGVGGISNGQDAYEKIKLGASLVQLYSALVYDGFYLVEKIKKELNDLLKKDGFSNINQAIGINNK